MKEYSDKIRLFFLIVIIVVFVSEGFLQAAEFNIKPSIYASAEYTDNAELKPSSEKHEDFITRIIPSIVANYNTPIITSHLAYELEYIDYQHFNAEDDFSHFIEASVLSKIIKDWFFLDVRDRYLRESLDITRDFTQESFFVNQSQTNEFRVEPYFLLRPTGRITLKTGYQYTNKWYRVDEGIDYNSHLAYITSEYTLSPRIALTAGADYKKVESEPDYEIERANGGINFRFAPYSIIKLAGGGVRIDIDDVDSYTEESWEATASHVQNMFKGVIGAVRTYSPNPDGNPLRVDRFWVSLMRLADYPEFNLTQAGIRFQFDVTVSYLEYTDLVTQDRTDDKYALSTRAIYDFTSRLRGDAHFTAEKIKRKIEQTDTKRYVTGVDLIYKLASDFRITASYIYGKSKTPESETNNYEADRYILALRKDF